MLQKTRQEQVEKMIHAGLNNLFTSQSQLNFKGASLFEDNINTNIFTTWTYQDLLPKLPPNSVVVMDNAAFHKNKDMQDKIKRTRPYFRVFARLQP